jgi:hypothetical protein
LAATAMAATTSLEVMDLKPPTGFCCCFTHKIFLPLFCSF